jgi:hypothetical protein
MYASIAVFNSGFIFVALVAFALLNWFQIPTGSLLDWAIGLGIFEWAVLIVTVPWNIYFSAKAVAQTGNDSQEQGITVDPLQMQYAQGIAKKALVVAIGLHLVTAFGLYWLAITGVTSLGYWGSVGVLLLTLLRPAVSTYEYLADRLGAMKQQFTYPRNDINELRDQLAHIESQLDFLNRDEKNSWINQQEYRWEGMQGELAKVSASIAELKATNDLEHQRMSQDAKQAISQITVDGKFLEQARELVRFIKTA